MIHEYHVDRGMVPDSVDLEVLGEMLQEKIDKKGYPVDVIVHDDGEGYMGDEDDIPTDVYCKIIEWIDDLIDELDEDDQE